MTSEPTPRRNVNPRRLLEWLEEAHWVQVGGREGSYARFEPPDDIDLGPRRRSLLVPLDTQASDFVELMDEAIYTIGRMPRESAAFAMLNRLTTTPTDAFSFAKETPAPKGWIQWDVGESLISAARGLLIAGAKTAREPRSYYGNRHGRFAHRFLDQVMMGQTDVSSYVVRAYVPVDYSLPISTAKQAAEGVHFEGQDVISTRVVSRAVVAALESATDALDHFQRHNSISGFTDPNVAISYESVLALKAIAEGAEYADITVSWDAVDSKTEHTQGFSFDASNVPVLERAAVELARPEPTQDAVATGAVHLLSRAEAGGPGVIGLTTTDGLPTRKLRVHLSAGDYAKALEAHGIGDLVTVTGILEREGSLSHLYSARVTRVSSAGTDDDVPMF